MKQLLIFSLIMLVSCDGNNSGPNPFESQDGTKTKVKEEPSSIKLYKQEDLALACLEGCRHSHDIFTNAKTIRKNSISLTLDQLDSIHKQCIQNCGSIVLRIPEYTTVEPIPEAVNIEEPQEEEEENSFEDLE